MTLLRWLPRFRAAGQTMREMEARERWSRPEIEVFQLDRLNRLWGHARTAIPYYSRLTAEHRLPDRFHSLADYENRMPVLPRVKVRDRPDDFLSPDRKPGSWALTGGTTGMPMRVYWEHAAHLETLRARYRFLQARGIDIFARCAFLWGHAHSYQRGLAGLLARLRKVTSDWLRNRIRLCAYDLGRSDLRRHLARIAAFGPVWLYGYSRATDLLAQEALVSHFECPSLQLAVLTAEPATPAIVHNVERGLRVQAVVEYGSIDCGVLAAEGDDRLLHVREDLVHLETAPRADGRYDLLVTVLNNPSFPLLRYQIGDVTETPLIRPERGMSRLPSVVGRQNDILVTRTGRLVHATRLDTLFKVETEQVRRFQVHQHTDGSVIATLDMLGPTNQPEVHRLERILTEIVEGFPVEVRPVGDITLTEAGKQRAVVSELDRGWANEPRQPALPVTATGRT